MALPVHVKHGGRAAEYYDPSRDELNTMLSRLLGGFILADNGDGGSLGSLGGYGVDIREDADHVYIEADLPGFTRDDVDISLENGTLAIVAERHEEFPLPSQQGGNKQAQQVGNAQQAGQAGSQQAGNAQQGKSNQDYLLRERRLRRFVRSFTLPPYVDEQNVQARMENGVLMITLNKREESKPKHIQVA